MFSPTKEVGILPQWTTGGNKSVHLFCGEWRQVAQYIERNDGSITMRVDHNSFHIVSTGQAQERIQYEIAHPFAYLVVAHIRRYIVFQLSEDGDHSAQRMLLSVAALCSVLLQFFANAQTRLRRCGCLSVRERLIIPEVEQLIPQWLRIGKGGTYHLCHIGVVWEVKRAHATGYQCRTELTGLSFQF